MLDKIIILLGSLLLLVGCGSDSSTKESALSIEQLEEVPELNTMSMALSP